MPGRRTSRARDLPSPSALGLALAAALGWIGCGADEAPAGLDLPDVDAPFALAGVGLAGQALDPRFVARLRTADAPRFVPERWVGVTVDGFVGGLAPEDLPEGLDVETMALVPPGGDGARPLPPLRRAHVLARPSPGDELPGFVPVEASTLQEAERLARTARLDELLAGVFVQPPCVGDPAETRVRTPRTPAESFLAARADPDGSVRLGLVASGTAAVAWFPPEVDDPILEGITVPGDELEIDSARVAVRALGPPVSASGPAEHVVLDVLGAFDQAGVLLRWSGRGYREDTPLVTEALVQTLRGVTDATLDGAPSTCAFGSVRGPLRDAGLWCRVQTSTTWRLELRVAEAQAITGLYPAGDRRHVAIDRTGAVHVREEGRWRTASEARVNRGCRPACAPFDVGELAEDGALAILGGAEAQLLTLRLANPMGLPRAVELLPRRTFVDEREGGERPLSFTSAAQSPDGRWWLGTAQGVLLRAEPDLSSLERVCLPSEAEGTITALAPAPDGRLVFGIGTGRVAFTRWDR